MTGVLDKMVGAASRQCTATYCTHDNGDTSRHWWDTCRTHPTAQTLACVIFWAFPMVEHELQRQKFSTSLLHMPEK
jgi:hypothetical protein